MIKKIYIKLILFSLILCLFCNINLFTQTTKVKDDKKDKDKEKIEKEKEEKEEKIKDIKEKLPKIKVQLESSGIVSEKIHSEKKDIENDNNININEYTEKIKQIKNFTNTMEDLQIKMDNMVRNIKQSTPENVIGVKEQYDLTKNLIENIEKENIIFLNNLDQEEKELIKQQSDSIQNSKNNLSKIMTNLDKEFEKKNKSIENLFDKIKELEKEIRIIYRQYRAIEWILFE